MHFAGLGGWAATNSATAAAGFGLRSSDTTLVSRSTTPHRPTSCIGDLMVIRRAPVTPGEILKGEFLAEYGLSQNQLVKAIGISPNRIAESRSGKFLSRMNQM